MILTKKLKLPINSTVESYKERGLLIKFQSSFTLKLYWDRCNCVVNNDQIQISYLKKWNLFMEPITTTWNNLLRKYEKNPIFVYEVTPLYKHFPIRMNLEDNVIGVYNYLGLKTMFYVKLNDIIKAQIKDKVLCIETYNDILTGSDLNKLKALRYKTHHKNLDKRVFTDGFLIKKL